MSRSYRNDPRPSSFRVKFFKNPGHKSFGDISGVAFAEGAARAWGRRKVHKRQRQLDKRLVETELSLLRQPEPLSALERHVEYVESHVVRQFLIHQEHTMRAAMFMSRAIDVGCYCDRCESERERQRQDDEEWSRILDGQWREEEARQAARYGDHYGDMEDW